MLTTTSTFSKCVRIYFKLEARDRLAFHFDIDSSCVKYAGRRAQIWSSADSPPVVYTKRDASCMRANGRGGL